MIAEGLHVLNEAAELAGTTILYRKIDALVNLAWMGYYIGRPAIVEDANKRVLECVPKGYWINSETGKPDLPPEQAQVRIWPQLGKLQVLFGHQACDQVILEDKKQLKQDKNDLLHQMAKFYILGLEYSILFSKEYLGIRQAKNQIYARFKKFSLADLRKITASVKKLEEEYHIPKSEFRSFLQNSALWFEE